MKFKAGDKVRCVEPFSDALVKGAIYTVEEANEYWVYVRRSDVDLIGGYRTHRFELVKDEPTPAATAISTQVGGDHYRNMKMQPIEFILANGIGFCEGAVIKYVSRWKAKGGVQDLKKARQFIDILIEHEEKANV